MIGRLLWNDIRHHKLMSFTTILFMAASAMLISLAAVLFTGLLGSVDRLMTKAQSCQSLQQDLVYAGRTASRRVIAGRTGCSDVRTARKKGKSVAE